MKGLTETFAWPPLLLIICLCLMAGFALGVFAGEDIERGRLAVRGQFEDNGKIYLVIEAKMVPLPAEPK